MKDIHNQDFIQFLEEVLGEEVSLHHRKVLKALQKQGNRIAVEKDNPTLTAYAVICATVLNPRMRVVLIHHNAEELKTEIQKEIRRLWGILAFEAPEITSGYRLTEKGLIPRDYANWEQGMVWKDYREGYEETLAGIRAKNLLYVVTNAPEQTNVAMGILLGSMTDKDNRMLLLGAAKSRVGWCEVKECS